MRSTLVFLHGNSSSKRVFDHQIKHFPKAIAEDLPGHGDNEPSSQPLVDYSVSVIKEKLINDYGDLTDVVLVGNSLGGHLAIEIAPHIKNLKALVIFGTPPLKKPLNIEEAFLPIDELSSYFAGSFDPVKLRENLSVVALNDSFVEPLFQDFIRTDPAFRDVWVKSATEDLELDDEVRIIESLSVPVHVIHGLQDPSVNYEYVKRLKGITEIHPIDNCGHYPSLEHPQKFNEVLEDILKTIE